MKKISFTIISVICLITILAVSGCVSPPEDTKSGIVNQYDPNNPNNGATVTTGTTPGVLNEATPFQTVATAKSGYSVIVESTPIPTDMVCLVDFTALNMTFESNRTAKKFNLVNPPMYINYNISKPFNVTGKRLVTERSGTEKTIEYSYYSPYSYLEITARDPVTGDIYVQDGFGKTYGSKLNKTIQISKPGELLIEVAGNNVTSSVGYWVKPSDNLSPEVINSSTWECRTQDYVKRLNQWT